MRLPRPLRPLAVLAATALAACNAGTLSETSSDAPSSRKVAIVVAPGEAQVAPGSPIAFSALAYGTTDSRVHWRVAESEGGVIDVQGRYRAPPAAGTYHIVASSVAYPSSDATAIVTVSASGSSQTPTPDRPAGAPSFGTAHSPNNLPISYWTADILAQYGGSSIVDSAATADLQACAFSGPHSQVVTKQVAWWIYYVQPSDTDYPVADVNGTARGTCPIDVGTSWDHGAYSTLRVPSTAMRWSTPDATAVPLNPGTAGDTDVHVTFVDVERNRIYSAYSYGGDSIGVFDFNGTQRWIASTTTCDTLHGSDSALQSLLSGLARYGCAGQSGYPDAACGLAGIGAGISAGAPFSNGDSNGFSGASGVIVPEDFDDTGWTGEAVGTFHHALRHQMPSACQYGYVWPQQDPAGGTTGKALRDGQIIQLDPAYDIVSDTGGSSPTLAQLGTRRLLKTLQVYGSILSDYGSWGWPTFFTLANWPGLGAAQDGAHSPWTAAGGASAGAEAWMALVGGSTHGDYGAILSDAQLARLRVVLPSGAAHPAP